MTTPQVSYLDAGDALSKRKLSLMATTRILRTSFVFCTDHFRDSVSFSWVLPDYPLSALEGRGGGEGAENPKSIGETWDPQLEWDALVEKMEGRKDVRTSCQASLPWQECHFDLSEARFGISGNFLFFWQININKSTTKNWKRAQNCFMYSLAYF